jgi:hypothetical protein
MNGKRMGRERMTGYVLRVGSSSYRSFDSDVLDWCFWIACILYLVLLDSSSCVDD